MLLQLLRVGSGGLAALLLGKALDFSLDGEPHWVLTFVLLYGCGLAAVLVCAWCWVLIDRRKRARMSPPAAEEAEPEPPPPPSTRTPDTPSVLETPSAPGAGEAILKAKGTNDNHFPRFESVRDSFGHMAERTAPDSLGAQTDRVLRPGQSVSFDLEASDPNGEDLEVLVLPPAAERRDHVTISDETVIWEVRQEDISDPAYVRIYLSSRRGYHRNRFYDDAASFRYRVLPRV